MVEVSRPLRLLIADDHPVMLDGPRYMIQVEPGQRNRRIGESLCVSEQTVKTGIKNILAKLQARDRTHAVSIAVQRGFFD
jgi:two-component system, NarL family, response regulator